MVWSAACSSSGGTDLRADRALLLTDDQVTAAVPTAIRLGQDQSSAGDDLAVSGCSSLLQRSWRIPAVDPQPPRDGGAIAQSVIACESSATARVCVDQVIDAVGDAVDFPVPDAIEMRRTVDAEGRVAYLAASAKGAQCVTLSLDVFAPPTGESDAHAQGLAGAMDDLLAHGSSR